MRACGVGVVGWVGGRVWVVGVVLFGVWGISIGVLTSYGVVVYLLCSGLSLCIISWKRIQVHSEDVVSTYTWKRMHAFGGIQALCSVAKGS